MIRSNERLRGFRAFVISGGWDEFRREERTREERRRLREGERIAALAGLGELGDRGGRVREAGGRVVRVDLLVFGGFRMIG